ncbi:MAG: EamA family transporter [Myxococcota bacterium]
MPFAALALVLVAACTHATWNLLAKRAAASRHFVWLYSVGAVIAWGPVAAAAPMPEVSTTVLAALAGTGVLHVAYSLALQRSYASADLSVVYPVVRGTGPLLAFVGAAAFLGERPSAIAALGAGLVVAGVLTLTGGLRVGPGLAHGLGTGALVASYTVWDGWAVKTLLVAPVLVDYAGNALRVVVLAPRAWRERASLGAELREYWRPALGVAVLGPLGYILVLSAMQLAPVSHVAPAREVSMLVAAWLGAKVLDERDAGRRIAASAVIVAGVVCLARG